MRHLKDNPVTIRFLDPPLHEFVPTEEEDIKKLAEAQGKSVEQIKSNHRQSLHEFNPMMGHRGCRLAVTYPEIAKMQTKRCYPCSYQCKESSSRLEHQTRDHDPTCMVTSKSLNIVKKIRSRDSRC